MSELTPCITSASFIAIKTNAVSDLSPAAEPPCGKETWYNNVYLIKLDCFLKRIPLPTILFGHTKHIIGSNRLKKSLKKQQGTEKRTIVWKVTPKFDVLLLRVRLTEISIYNNFYFLLYSRWYIILKYF